MHPKKNNTAGMTLLECLVALAIGSLLSLMLVSMTSHVLRMHQHRDQRLKRELPMHQLAILLDRDIRTMIPKQVQWSSGDLSSVVSVGNQRWCWTSLGVLNVDANWPESSWHRVCYEQNGSRLLRLVWPPGDGRAHDDARVTDIWEHIQSVHVTWPVVNKKKQTDPLYFWPRLWSWQVVSDHGVWQVMSRVRVWPKESSG